MKHALEPLRDPRNPADVWVPRRLTAVGIGTFGWHVARSLSGLGGWSPKMTTEAVAILDRRPAGWTALPYTVVYDASEARQLGTDIAELMHDGLVVIAGDGADPLYADTMPWVAGLAREFGATCVEIVRADVDSPAPQDPRVGLSVRSWFIGPALTAANVLVSAWLGQPGIDHRCGGLVGPGTGLVARFASLIHEDLVERVGRRVSESSSTHLPTPSWSSSKAAPSRGTSPRSISSRADSPPPASPSMS